MSIEKLFQLQSQVETALTAKVAEERRDLEAKLSQLSRLGNGHSRLGRPRGSSSSLSGTTVAPKYRNPENPCETWAGRGLRPRWLTAAMKGGKKLEDFMIGGAAKAAAAQKDAPKKAWSASQDGVEPTNFWVRSKINVKMFWAYFDETIVNLLEEFSGKTPTYSK